MKSTTTLLLALIALIAIPAAAATVDRTFATGPDPEVSFEGILGSIQIIGWDRNEVHITGVLGTDIRGLEIDADDDEIDIEVEYPDRRDGKLRDGEANLEISVPRGSDISIETVKGTIDVENVNGELELSTVHGDITVNGGASQVEAETVSGDIRISGSNTEIDVDSVSGAVIVTGATGDVAVETMNGIIEVDAARVDSASLDSMSGSIQFRGDLTADADLTIEGYSSNVVLVLPSTVSATFEVETQSGNIENDFGPQPQRIDGFMPGKVLEFSLGNGSADITVESFSGNVKILRDDG